MYLVYNIDTGAELRREAEPVLAEGEAAEALPASAMLATPTSMWSANGRGFIDVPLVDGPMMGRLLHWSEVVAMVHHPAPEISRVPILWMLLIAFGRPQRANDALHISTGMALHAGGIFDDVRLAQFLAAEPVEEAA